MAFKFNPITNRLDITGVSGGGSGISSITGNSGGPIGPDGSNNINIVGGGSVTVTGSGNTLTITVPSTFFSWSVITANQTAVKFNGYFINGGSRIDLTLPATSDVGDTFSVIDKGGNLFRILQAAGQYIKYQNSTTTTGATGSVTSQVVGDSLTLVCSVANTEWFVQNSSGTYVVV